MTVFLGQKRTFLPGGDVPINEALVGHIGTVCWLLPYNRAHFNLQFDSETMAKLGLVSQQSADIDNTEIFEEDFL